MRFDACSFIRIRRTKTLTVFSVIFSSCAMILFGLPWRRRARTSLSRGVRRLSALLMLGRRPRSVLPIMGESDHGAGGNERAARRDALQRGGGLGGLEAGRDVAAHALLYRLDNIVDVVAVGQQDQRNTAHMAPQQGDLAEHLGIPDRGGANAEDDAMGGAERSGGVEQVCGTTDRDDAQIRRSFLQPAAEALSRQRPAIDQNDRYARAEFPAMPGLALHPQGRQGFASFDESMGAPSFEHCNLPEEFRWFLPYNLMWAREVLQSFRLSTLARATTIR